MIIFKSLRFCLYLQKTTRHETYISLFEHIHDEHLIGMQRTGEVQGAGIY